MMLTQAELKINAFLEHADLVFVETARESLEQPAIDVRRGRAAPEREGRAQAAGRVFGAALRGIGGAIANEPFEVRDIERFVWNVNYVADRRRTDELARSYLTELPPERRYAGLNLALRGDRRLAVPQSFDNPIERHNLAL